MDPTSEEMSALAEQLSLLAKGLATNTDPLSKKNQTRALVAQAKQIIAQTQDPFEALMDHVVNAYTIGSMNALLEIGVFEAIPPSGTIGIHELASKCNADESLITRLMRQLTCMNIFAEPSLGEFSHNRLSIGLSDHVGVTGKYFFAVSMNELSPCFHSLNRYLQKYGKKDVTTYTHTPHSWYDGSPDKNFWEVLSSDPKRLEAFDKGLSLFSSMHPVLGLYPFEENLKEGNSLDRPLAVDVGGGRGLAMLELKKGCPNLRGEVFLQDRQIVLDSISAEELPGVTKMPHDFFTEQPVKNAQVYYIRRVLHDWQDVEATSILKAIIPAMGKDSRILISDMTMPEPVKPQDAGAIWMDLMMLTIGGKERSARDWTALAGLAGLKLIKVWQDPAKFGPLSVVEYMLKDEESGHGLPAKEISETVSGEAEAGKKDISGPVTNGFSQLEVGNTEGKLETEPISVS